MCRNIRALFNYDPPTTDEEVRAAAIQFVRKVSGSTKPSKVNKAAYELAVNDIAVTVRKLLDSLVTSVPPRNREVEVAKARAKRAQQSEPQH